MFKRKFLPIMLLLMISMIPLGCQSKEAAPPVATTPAPQTTEAAPQNFSYQELTELFNETGQTLIKQFGQPLKITDSEGAGVPAKQYTYDGMVFQLGFFESDAQGSVYEATLFNDKIPAPRGIRIGNSLASVLGKFPQASTEKITDGDGHYQMLYGKFENMTDFGYVEYQKDTAIKIFYTNEGVGLEFLLQDDKVTGYHYFMTMN